MSEAATGALAFLLFVFQAQAQTSPDHRVLTHRSAVPTHTAGATDRPTVTVPAETEAEIQLLSGLHSKVTDADDPVRAQLLRPVLVNGRIVLPTGSFLDGRVIRVRPASRLHRPGELALRFEQITLPDGESEPVSAVLTHLDKHSAPRVHIDSEGYLKGTRALSWKGITGGMLAFGTAGAAKLGFAGSGALAGVWLPATGSVLLAYEIFWPRGNEVHIPPDTYARVRLNYPLTVRVPW